MLLDAAALAARGLPGQVGWTDSVRFAELDPLGHVNNVAYLAWFEMIRVRYLIEIGLTRYRAGEPGFVVRRLDAEYRAEMKLHDDYVLTAETTRVGRTSLEHAYAVHSKGAVAATGTCTVVMVVDGRAAPLTEAMRAALAAG